jgi:TRAP transporter 4TM/12TM fusion protein
MSAPADQKLDHVPEESAGMFDTEAPTRRLDGIPRLAATILTTGLAAYALYWVLAIIDPQVYRVSFLLIALAASFLMYPARRSRDSRVSVLDWFLIAATVISLGWPLVDFARFVYRAAEPTSTDRILGLLAVILILEGTRRTVGWILPVTAIVFLLYGYYGALLDRVGLGLFAHRGYGLDRLVGSLYMTLEGIFGIPLDVAASYIILFTIYGAVLRFSGAGKFFLDWAMAALGRSGGGAGPGRTVTGAGALLGMISGSGVANTVMLGSVAWPMLKQAGYTADVGGAILSAAGIGAILTPPMLGAAAFLIAEFLKISYLQVVVMAAVPAALYYLSVLLMIEADSRRLGTRNVAVGALSLKELTFRYGYHFASPVAVVAFMVFGITPFRAVFWAMLLAAALSFIRPETALWPRKVLQALEAAGAGVLSVAATTATAGIIVGVVTLTGLGLKIAGIIVTFAAGSLALTVVYSAIAVSVLGLAVPVTASYIIAAVMIAPALTQSGVPAAAAHMFIFYYAVLSEVSPPTALSPFAAAALTGGNPFRTMMLTWKYTLPAFLVPFVFTLTKDGTGVLLQAPLSTILTTSVTAVVGVAALAMGMGGWIRQRASFIERLLATAGGLLLMYARIEADVVGVFCAAIAIGLHLWRTNTAAGNTT